MYSALTDIAEARAQAAAALGHVAARYPRAAGSALATAEALLGGPRQVADIGPAEDYRTAALLAAARHSSAPDLVLAVGQGRSPALLAGRIAIDDVPTAHACRAFVCELPTTDRPSSARSCARPPDH